eukprot:scaffold492_cov347-Prasinococcus_capsulatus_cf.AAC.6
MSAARVYSVVPPVLGMWSNTSKPRRSCTAATLHRRSTSPAAAAVPAPAPASPRPQAAPRAPHSSMTPSSSPLAAAAAASRSITSISTGGTSTSLRRSASCGGGTTTARQQWGQPVETLRARGMGDGPRAHGRRTPCKRARLATLAHPAACARTRRTKPTGRQRAPATPTALVDGVVAVRVGECACVYMYHRHCRPWLCGWRTPGSAAPRRPRLPFVSAAALLLRGGCCGDVRRRRRARARGVTRSQLRQCRSA